MSEKYSGSRAELPELTIVGTHAHLFENPRIKELVDEYRALLPTLNEVVAELQTKAGVKVVKKFPATFRVGDLEDEERERSDRTVGGWFGTDTENEISISTRFVTKQRELLDRRDQSRAQVKRNMCMLLIHESLHSMSHVSRMRSSSERRTTVGLAGEYTSVVSPHQSNIYGSTLDEAVTEHLTCVVYAEALRRSGGQVCAGGGRVNEVLKGSVYLGFRTVLYRLLEKKSKTLGVPENLLWEVIVRQYFNNEVDTRKFLEHLSISGTSRDARKLEKVFASNNITADTIASRLESFFVSLFLNPDRLYPISKPAERNKIELTRSALFKK